MTRKFYVEIVYSDGSNFHFNVEIEGLESSIIATLHQITRGTLMTSSGVTSCAYREDGSPICSYRQ